MELMGASGVDLCCDEMLPHDGRVRQTQDKGQSYRTNAVDGCTSEAFCLWANGCPFRKGDCCAGLPNWEKKDGGGPFCWAASCAR